MSASKRKAPQAQPQLGDSGVFKDSVLEADPILSNADSERKLSEVKVTGQARAETEKAVARLKAKFDNTGKIRKGKGQANKEKEKEGKKINFSFFGFKK